MLSVDHWATNGELIADAWKMYVEPRWPEPRCMDVTYGRGLWWTHVNPPQLVKHDIHIDGVDFRSLPYDDGSFDAVFFDPDYVAPGGRKTSTIPDFNDRYGLKPEYETPDSLERNWIFTGLDECLRVTDNHGLVFVKCANYVTSGRLWRGVEHITQRGVSFSRVCPVCYRIPKIRGLRFDHIREHVLTHHPKGAPLPPPVTLYDMITHVSGTGPQPKGRGHLHARSNSSVLLIFRKGGRRRKVQP